MTSVSGNEPAILPVLTGEQETALRTIWELRTQEGQWPEHSVVRVRLQKIGIKLDEALRPLPYFMLYKFEKPQGVERLRLKLGGLAFCPEATPNVRAFLSIVKVAATCFIERPTPVLELTSEVATRGVDMSRIDGNVLGDLMSDEFPAAWFHPGASEKWIAGLDARMIRYKRVATVADFVRHRHRERATLTRLETPHVGLLAHVYRHRRDTGVWPSKLEVALLFHERLDVLSLLDDLPNQYWIEDKVSSEQADLAQIVLKPDGAAVSGEADRDLDLLIRVIQFCRQRFFESDGRLHSVSALELSTALSVPETDLDRIASVFRWEMLPGLHFAHESGSWSVIVQEKVLNLEHILSYEDLRRFIAAERGDVAEDLLTPRRPRGFSFEKDLDTNDDPMNRVGNYGAEGLGNPTKAFLSKPGVARVRKALVDLLSHAEMKDAFSRYGLEATGNPGGNKLNRASCHLDHQDWANKKVVQNLLELVREQLIQPTSASGGRRNVLDELIGVLKSEGFEWTGSQFRWPLLKGGPDLTKGLHLNLESIFYSLVSPISSGANGQVWEAEIVNSTELVGTARRVAIKIFSPNPRFQDERSIKRFKREFEFLKRARHPNLVKVFRRGELQDGWPAYSMELMAQNLETLLQTNRTMPVSRRIELVKHLFSGLAYIHALNPGDAVVHRDLKPKNILLDDQGVLKIGDFGIAHANLPDLAAEYRDLTTGSEGLRNRDYRAPEQEDIRFGSVGPHSDVFSAGLIAYEILTGIKLEELPPASHLASDTPQVLSRALESIRATMSIAIKERPPALAIVQLLEKEPLL